MIAAGSVDISRSDHSREELMKKRWIVALVVSALLAPSAMFAEGVGIKVPMPDNASVYTTYVLTIDPGLSLDFDKLGVKASPHS
jgi:hypothetical protein